MKDEKDLTKTEKEILNILRTHPHQYYSCTELYQLIYHETPCSCEGTIYVHVHNLRRKIESSGSSGHLLVKKGTGYYWQNT